MTDGIPALVEVEDGSPRSPVTANSAATVKEPKLAARLLMAMMLLQALLGVTQFGLTAIMTYSVVSDVFSWEDLGMIEKASQQVVEVTDYLHWPTATAFIVWFAWAASTNKRRGKKVRFGPGWAVASFFIPVVSLILPYQVMGEVFDTSARQPNGTRRFLVGGWWLTFILTRVVGLISRMTQGNLNLEESSDILEWNATILVESGLWISAAVFALLLVREVNQRQAWTGDGAKLAEVFA